MREFGSFLRIERGIAENSREAYLSDLRRYRAFAEGGGLESPVDVRLEHVQEYLTGLVDLGVLNSRSLARNILLPAGFPQIPACRWFFRAGPHCIDHTSQIWEKTADSSHCG